MYAGLTQAGFEIRSTGDAACQGGIVGDAREDGPQGCVWACTAAADGMVPAGARQIDWVAGDPSAAGRAQAASRKVAGCGIEHSGNPARFRPEGRPGDPQNVGGPPGAGLADIEALQHYARRRRVIDVQSPKRRPPDRLVQKIALTAIV